MTSAQGFFITFEGIDGVGKSTQVEALVAHLRKTYPELEVVTTREPGGTRLGQNLRQEILHGENIDKRTELLLYLADRAEHVAKKIKPAIERGAVVISDRFSDSTLAYQASGRQLNPVQVELINDFATDYLTPNLTVLLDLSAEESRSRVESTGEEKDRLESEKLDFFERTRARFLEMATADNFLEGGRFMVIDANLTAEEISDKIWAVVGDYLRGRA